MNLKKIFFTCILCFVGRFSSSQPALLEDKNRCVVKDFTIKENTQTSSFIYAVKVEGFKVQNNLPELKQEIQEIALMGHKDILFVFVWPLIETQNNIYNWLKYDEAMQHISLYNLNVWAQVWATPGWANSNSGPTTPPSNVQNYADFVDTLLSHYQGQIKGVEIWNEPNMPGFWNSSALVYVNLLNTAYNKIKTADSSIIVISGGLASDGNVFSMEDFLSLTPMFDWLGYHPYARYYSPAESSITPLHGISNLYNVKAKLNSYGYTNQPIFITEFGYSATTSLAGGNVPSWGQVAIYLPESFALAQSFDYVKGLVWFHYKGYTNTDYGLVDTIWNKRDGYYADSTMLSILPYYTFDTQLSGNVDQTPAWVLKLNKESDSTAKLWFLFAPYINNSVMAPQSVTLNVGTASFVTLTDLNGNQQMLTPDVNENVVITVTGSPYYLETNAVNGEIYHSVMASIIIYPNPTNGILRITNLYKFMNMELKIFNVLGNVVFEKTANSKHETLSLDLPSGMYFLRVYNENFIATQKLIIQNQK